MANIFSFKLSILFAAFTFAVTASSAENEHLLRFTYLGTEDGNVYFADPDTPMNWTDAREYCRLSNLKLVSVENEVQAGFLNEVIYKNFEGAKLFWSSAREARSDCKGFQWDGTGGLQPSPDHFARGCWHYNTGSHPYNFCMGFQGTQHDGKMMAFARPCDTDSLYPLCQT